MWNWNSGKLGYYADFILVPILMLVALAAEVHYHGWGLALVAAFFVGAPLWTFAEYWIHRTLFHVFMRRQHWLHHKRPRGYVTAPSWLTAPLHLAIYGALVGGLGMAAGTGMFLGLEAGYLSYIGVHDRIHHGDRTGAYIQRRAALHYIHHHEGIEKNFGVASSFWDRLFRTHQESAQGT